MKITVFNGSPKGKHSNTHIMVQEFLTGARECGADGEEIFLGTKKIRNCLGCFTCWTKTPGKCAIADDMSGLLDAYLASDLVVYASPVYFGGATGLMKNFVDRTLPFADPHFKKDAQGVTRHLLRYEKYPDIVVISNCGFPDTTCFKYFDSLFEFLDGTGQGRVLARIYCGEGALLSVPAPSLAPILNKYFQLLRQAGRELASERYVSETTKTALAKPLLPVDVYVDMINKHWDS